MNIDPEEERKRLYSETRTDLLTRQLSNSEKLDGAILTLSTAALGVSIAFIENIVPLEIAQYVIFLIFSWCLFGASIISTLVSFITSQIAIKTQLYFAEEYYLKKKDEFLTKPNKAAKYTDRLNYSSAFLFIAALLFTIAFATINLGGQKTMANNNIKNTTQRGATVPNLRPVSGVQNGATVPTMQPVPTGQQGGSSASSGGGSGSQSGGGQSGQSSQGSK